jgi:hypothetical protein
MRPLTYEERNQLSYMSRSSIPEEALRAKVMFRLEISTQATVARELGIRLIQVREIVNLYKRGGVKALQTKRKR